MNPYAVPSLLAFLVDVALVAFVLSANPKSRLNRVFALLISMVAAWGFGEFIWRASPNAETAALWMKIIAFSWCFLAGFYLHFALIFSGKEGILKHKLSYVFLYGPGFVFYYLGWFQDLFTREMVLMDWGYSSVMAKGYWIYLAWLGSYFILGLIFVFGVLKKATHRLVRKQALFLIIGTLIPLTIGTINDGILPMLKVPTMGLTTLSSTGMAGIITYAIIKYQLMAITPAATAESIIATMTDSLTVIDPQAHILMVNQACLDLLGYGRAELIGRPFNFICDERFKEMMLGRLVEKGSIRDVDLSYCTKSGGKIPVSFSGSLMRDGQGEVLGILCLARDMRERIKAEECSERLNKELEKKIEALEEFKRITVDRELKMIELKNRIKELGGRS